MPYPPGGSVDVLGRLVAQRMQENWGQSVIVENRPGAGTMIGTAAAAKSDPDGYTLIIVVSGHTHQPYVCSLPDSANEPTLVTSAGAFGRLVTDVTFT